jgi:aryl-alcohol dehydrogenase-like predicted oxidoreductase
MRYRLLGRTGLYVSELALGTMTWGGGGLWDTIGGLGIDEATLQLSTALEGGVNLIDTADYYATGRSEEILGEALRRLAVPRDEIVVATKVRLRMGPGPNRVGLSRVHIVNALEASLRRLGLDHVDLYQTHQIDPLTPIDETLRALDDVVRAGKVRYIGCCNLPAWYAMKSLAVSERLGLARFESMQVYYTAATRDLEYELMPLARDQGLGILVWSPLAGGLLTGKYHAETAPPEGARRTRFDFPPVDRAAVAACLEAIGRIAERHRTRPARVALAWLLARGEVTSVIVGARNLDQLRVNLGASGLALDPEDLAAIDAAAPPEPLYPHFMVERTAADRRPDAVPGLIPLKRS